LEEIAGAFPVRQPATVLKAAPDEQVDQPVGHVHNLLNRTLGLIVVAQEV
jgi:hypothetical protein